MQQECQLCGAKCYFTVTTNISYENKDGLYKRDLCQDCLIGRIDIPKYKFDKP